MKIHSYVVARDFGFAPNPFFGYCTLANCKPKIRKYAKIGDYVIGTRCSPNPYRIVFFMQIQEILSFQEYWDDERFTSKKPVLSGSRKFAFGDNIYSKNIDGVWLQQDSHHTNYDGSTNLKNLRTDVSGENVLVSNDFCYWGDKSPLLPAELQSLVKKGVGHKSDFSPILKQNAENWMSTQPRGILGNPIDW